MACHARTDHTHQLLVGAGVAAELIRTKTELPHVSVLLAWYVLCVSLSKTLFKLRDSLSFPIDLGPFPQGPECLQCR